MSIFRALPKSHLSQSLQYLLFPETKSNNQPKLTATNFNTEWYSDANSSNYDLASLKTSSITDLVALKLSQFSSKFISLSNP